MMSERADREWMQLVTEEARTRSMAMDALEGIKEFAESHRGCRPHEAVRALVVDIPRRVDAYFLTAALAPQEQPEPAEREDALNAIAAILHERHGDSGDRFYAEEWMETARLVLAAALRTREPAPLDRERVLEAALQEIRAKAPTMLTTGEWSPVDVSEIARRALAGEAAPTPEREEVECELGEFTWEDVASVLDVTENLISDRDVLTVAEKIARRLSPTATEREVGIAADLARSVRRAADLQRGTTPEREARDG
jgi:hypothetical protein